MTNRVTGTFTAQDQNSSSITAKAVAIDMTFAGTATVNVQWLVDGTNWRTISDGSYTASKQIVVEAPGIPIRLNCSAHTNNVDYALAVAGQ